MKTIVGRAAAFGLLALLGAGTGAWAMPGEEPGKDRRIEKHRIVIVGPDGKERVIEGAGPLVRRGYLGIGLTELTPQLRTHFGAPEDAGVMVSSIEAGSPAEKAGLEVGDIIARIEGQEVQSSWDLRSRLRDAEEGEQVQMEVWRKGRAQTLSATVALRERPELDMGPLFMRRGEGEPMLLGELPERIELPHARELRIERSPRELQLEKRLQELEKRLQELERQLAKREK